MKKLVMGLLGAMMILSLAACTPTTEKNKTGEVKEPQQEDTVYVSNAYIKYAKPYAVQKILNF